MARKSRKNSQNTPTIQASKRYIAGIYARISSEDQKGDSIESQEKIGRQYLESCPDVIIHRVYIDYGLSSFARIRPGFNDLILDAELQKINCIVVKDISRLSRDYLEASDLIQKVFPRQGIRFISVNDEFDSLHCDETKLEIALRSLLYYHYSIDLSKKIQSAIGVRQISGDYVPARLPYGYIKVQTEYGVEWQPDEKTASIVKYIFSSALAGLSAYGIAGNLNRQGISGPNSNYWSSSSVLRILRDASYTGMLIAGKTRNNRAAGFRTESKPQNEWIKHYNHHTPIVDDITFYSMQRILSERNTSISKGQKVEDFFIGKLYCGMCGRKMRPKRSVNGSVYYICPRRDEAAASCVNKAKSEAKLKRQTFIVLSEQMDEVKERYYKMLDYENSPYFIRNSREQDRQFQEYQCELERQNYLFKAQYEESITKNLTHSADYRNLMEYLRRVRLTLSEQIAEIEQMRADHQQNKLLINAQYQTALRFQEYAEVTSDMLSEIIERVYVDLDGVRVVLRLDNSVPSVT